MGVNLVASIELLPCTYIALLDNMAQCFFVCFCGGRGGGVSPEVVSPNDATSQPDLIWVAKLGPVLMN